MKACHLKSEIISEKVLLFTTHTLITVTLTLDTRTLK
jgi:hypothetical protein